MKVAATLAIGAAAGVMIASWTACGQEHAAAAGAAGDPTYRIDQARAQARADKMAQMTAELNINSNQQSRIRAILDQQDVDMARHQDESLTRQKALAEAFKAQDRTAQEKLRAEMAAASNRQMEIYRKHSQAILDVLTPEQQSAWRVFGVYQSIVGMRLRGCTLSDEQQGRIRAMCKSAVGASSATAMAREDYVKLTEEVEKTVLTDSQRDEILLYPIRSRVLRDLHGCALTPEQDARIRALCLEAAKASRPASTNDAGAARPESPVMKAREVVETVKATVLTEAQKLDMESEAVFESLIHVFAKCSLTPDQEARVRTLCREAAAGLGASPDYTARSTARRTVIEKARADVLNEAQRALVPAPKPPVRVMPVETTPTNAPPPSKAP